MFRFLSKKNMSNGMRNMSKTPLTIDEIEYVKAEINRIEADADVFVFNDEYHISSGTCYNFLEDKVYVSRNVFPDIKYGSRHPRDIMSVAAVLAHEYYGHRYFREEYLKDKEKGEGFHTTPLWEDECRASITAARFTPNLTDMERSHLIMDAIYRAEEAGQIIELDDFMKEVLYGYSGDEKNITYSFAPIHFISKESVEGMEYNGEDPSDLSEMSSYAMYNDDYER